MISKETLDLHELLLYLDSYFHLIAVYWPSAIPLSSITAALSFCDLLFNTFLVTYKLQF
jgi:hypothetical protein